MDVFFPVRQTTLHIPNTGPRNQGHLFVILTNSCKNKQHLLVPICSVRPGCDRTCLLGKGDHKFIRHLSYVDYSNAGLFDTKILIKRVQDGTFSYEGLMPDKVFALICLGVLNSRHMTPRLRRYYEENSGN